MKTGIKLLTAIFCLFTLNLSAQTAEEIVANHIEAIGGAENWNKIKSLKMEHTLKAEGADIQIKIAQVDKKAIRQDISVMGMTGYNIISNTEGWNYMPWQGQTKAEPMTADDVKSSQDELNIKDEFITYKEMDKKLESFGKDDIDGTECFKIKLTDKNGKETTYYLDASNYYIIKQTQKKTVDGKEVENSTFFSDYKKLEEGIIFPMSISSNWGSSQITKIEINPVIDESIFKPAN